MRLPEDKKLRDNVLPLIKRAFFYFLPLFLLTSFFIFGFHEIAAKDETVFYLSYLLISLGLASGAFVVARLKHREEETRQAMVSCESRHQRLVETSVFGIEEIDTKGNILFGSRAYHKMHGYDAGELNGMNIRTLLPGESQDRTMTFIASLVSEQRPISPYIDQHLKKDGAIIDVEVAWNYNRSESGALEGFVSVVTDITQRVKAEKDQRLAASVFESSSEGIVITNARRRIISVNKAFTKITGYTPEEVIGRNPRFLKSDQHNQAFYRAMWSEIETEGCWQGEIRNRRKNREPYTEWLSITSVKDAEGHPVQYIGLIRDISDLKANEEKLHFQAFYDPLTQLPNRALLFERLSHVIKQASRNRKTAALLFVDLDYFKQINDTFGHVIGDEILKEVSERLSACVREADTVARPGGDEFLIILHEISGRTEATTVAKKVIRRLKQPFRLEGHNAFLGASIGITLIPDDGNVPIDLLKKADMAMYKSKEKGRNTYCYFSEKMEKISKERTLMEWDLRRALEDQELLLYYQPIKDLFTLKTVGQEALLRWKHPKRGLIPPAAFIPLAENSDLISQIGAWVLETACRQAKQWQMRYGFDQSISVNVSSREFKTGDIESSVTKALQKSALPPKYLTLEITEGMMIDSSEEAVLKLQKIKDIGVKLSVDDFGTGYSSLSYLSRYPIDLLKIDKSFIQGLLENTQKKPLVEAIVRMGQGLGMKVIAEGVETHDDLNYLIALGCDEAQGYYFSKPLSVEDCEAVFEKQTQGK